MRTKLLISVFITFASYAYAQTVKIDAEIRSRGEYRDGFRLPLADTINAAFINNLRTKINTSYESDKVKAKLSLLDTRTFGQTPVSSTGNGIDILEAWGEYQFTPGFSFALGRQGLEYDDRRIFSLNNWSNTPGAHDLLLLKYSKNGFTLHAGSAYNNSGDSIRFLSPYRQSYKTLNYIWLNKSFKSTSVSAIWVNDSYEYGSTGNMSRTYRNTIGGYLWLMDTKKPFHAVINGYYQFGRDRQDRRLRAWLLSAKATYKVSPIWQIYAGTDIFSGSDNDLSADKNHKFNKLYGTNHAFNGSMEYWATLPSQGLHDIYGGITAEIGNKLRIDIAYHHFATNKEISTDGIKNIGSEIDLTLDYKLNEEFSLQSGWSSYFTTKGTDILKNTTGINTRFPQWAYLQITFKPVFI